MEDSIMEKPSDSSDSKKSKKNLQLERTRVAFERLQLAWVRTCLTIIVIGIGVNEFFYQRMESGKKPLFEEFTGRELALILYSLASGMMFLSLVQHQKSMAQLKKSYIESRFSIAFLLSVLLLLLGFFLTGMLLWKASTD